MSESILKRPECIFLMSSERSGSNLLTRLFNSHPLVCGPAPTHLGSELLANIHRYSLPTGSDVFLDDFHDLFGAKMGRWSVELKRGELGARLDALGPLGLYLDLYASEADAHGKPIAFIKENRLYDFQSLLNVAPRRLGFVYLVRDPRDMALSWLKAPALRGGVMRAARIWKQDQREFLRLIAQWKHNGRSVPVVRYEDLLSDPEGALSGVCDAVGIPPDSRMLDFSVSAETRGHARAATEWSNLSQPLMRDNAGRYRGQLDQEQLRFVEAVCAEEMQAFGYLPEARPVDSDEFARIESALEMREPWDKPAYSEVPETEREHRKHQHACFVRIRTRPISRVK